MLFSKNIEPMCSYCQRGRTLEADTVLCIKRGSWRPAAPARLFATIPSNGCRPGPSPRISVV